MTIYTDSIIVNSPLLYISGQTPQHNSFIPDAIEQQLDIVIDKINTIIIRNNCTKENLVNMNIYLTHRDFLPCVRHTITQYLGDTKPTMTLVIVSGLVNELFKVEIDAVVQVQQR